MRVRSLAVRAHPARIWSAPASTALWIHSLSLWERLGEGAELSGSRLSCAHLECAGGRGPRASISRGVLLTALWIPLPLPLGEGWGEGLQRDHIT